MKIKAIITITQLRLAQCPSSRGRSSSRPSSHPQTLLRPPSLSHRHRVRPSLNYQLLPPLRTPVSTRLCMSLSLVNRFSSDYQFQRCSTQTFNTAFAATTATATTPAPFKASTSLSLVCTPPCPPSPKHNSKTRRRSSHFSLPLPFSKIRPCIARNFFSERRPFPLWRSRPRICKKRLLCPFHLCIFNQSDTDVRLTSRPQNWPCLCFGGKRHYRLGW